MEIMDVLLCMPTFSCPSDNIGRDHIGDLCMHSTKSITVIVMAKFALSHVSGDL